eukprot:m.105188 g.105188  ORF g.105188 m.105188 type:complete len:590 (-) comp15275_c0_seq2:92-1861(-)
MEDWYDLNISPDLQRGLGLKHALSELRANANDADGVGTSYLFDSSAGTATFVNGGPALLPDDLIIGQSKSRDDPSKAGVHGLGLKDAIAILYGSDYTMTIESHCLTYEFALMPSNFCKGSETIHARLTPSASNSPNTTVIIKTEPGNVQQMRDLIAAEPAPAPDTTRSLEHAPQKKACKRKATHGQHPTPQQGLFSKATDPDGGRCMYLRVWRHYPTRRLHFDWKLGKKSNRKEWFDSSQNLKREFCQAFETLIRGHLNRCRVTAADFPPGARDTLEYQLLAPVMELDAAREPSALQQEPPCKAMKSCLISNSIPKAIEMLNGMMAEHHRRSRYLVSEVQQVLQEHLGIVVFYPAGSYRKSTQLPASSDLDLVVVYEPLTSVSLAEDTKHQLHAIKRSLEAGFPTRHKDIIATRFSVGCKIDGVQVDILPVLNSIWRATASTRQRASPDDEPFYSAAMAREQVEKFAERAERAGKVTGLDVRPVIRLLKAWLSGHGPWAPGTKPRSCLVEELTLLACEESQPIPGQEALAKAVVTRLSELPAHPIVPDPVYKPNNLAKGLDPAVVVGHAKAALVNWPETFLQRVEAPRV